MIHKITKAFFILVVAFTTSMVYSQNLISNGDFESGGNGVGFNVNSSFYNELTPPFSGNTVPGNYAVTNTPQAMNTASFLPGIVDHTTGTGNMLVVDAATAGTQRFWRAGNNGGGVCGLTVGATYTFSYWIRTISNTGGPAVIAYQFNNTSNVVLVSGSATAGASAAGWQQVVYTFRPTNACVNIELWDTNTNAAGNDFAFDDVTLLAPPLPLAMTYSITNQTCIGVNDGTIFGYGIGGTPPYTYTLSGAIPATTNATGFFTGLAPGNYTLLVRDNVNATVQQTGITFPVRTGITLTAASTSICIGGSTSLTATGGGTYTWSVDNAEAVPTGANPTVSPSVTTTYTVNSTTATPDNLIYNGDFFLGNAGFTSDYTYYNPTNPALAQKAYGVVTDAEVWEAPFSACNDHTNGAGRMLVVDGSTANGGNDKVWCQTVPVVPGQNYSITYWVQTLALPNPANIDVTINGVSQGTALAPASTCLWNQQSYNWTAGVGVTTAQICFYTRNTSAAGNDFALDDIVFSRTNTCILPPKSVTITVTNSITLTTTNPTAVCAPSTVDLTAPAVTAGSTTGTTLTYWNDAAATTSQISTLAASAIATSGTYYIRSTSGTCSIVRPVTVTITAAGSTPAPTVITPVWYCNGDIATALTATALPGATLNWYANATGGPVLPGAPTPSTAVDGLTVYYVSQTIGTCEGPRRSITVAVRTPFMTTYNFACDPTAVTVPNSVYFNWDNIYNPPPVYNYTYSINGGPLVSGSTNLSHYEVVGVLPGQSATITIVSATGFPCITSQSYTCSNCVTLTVPTFTLPSSICTGSVAPTLPTTSNNGISGTWSPTTISNTTGGTYIFTPDTTLFPCADDFSKTIAVANPPNPGTLNGTQNVCVGLTTAFSSTVTGGTWSSQNTAIATVNASTGVVTGVSNGTISIDYTVPGTGGCGPVTISRSVTVTNPPTPGTLSGNQAICVANTTTFNSTIAGGTWNSSSNAIATINASTGLITGVSAGVATMTYTVTGTGGCLAVTSTRTVTVSAIPSAGVISGNQAICIGLSTVFTSTVTGGTWSSSDSTIATVSSTGDIIGIAVGTATISYIVNGTGGCPASPAATRTVTVSAPQNPGILSGGQTICAGGTTTFTSTVTGGNWTSSNTTVATINATTGVIVGVTAGNAIMTYTITGTGGCANTNTTRQVTVNPNIVPTFNAVAPICEGTALTPLPTTSTNGITGTWGPALDNTTTTEYTFTPTAGLCATTARLTITVNPRIVPLFGLFAPLCQGAVAPILPTNSDNIPAITGNWNPPTVSTVNLGTTIYTFNPTAGQCVSNTLTTLSITVVPVLTPNFQPIPAFCDGFTAPLLSNTSPNGVEGTWQPSVISNTLSGSYLFTPNPDQCAVTQTLNVTIIPRTVPDFAAIPAFCKGFTAPVLPLTSPNGITGTWFPAVIDNTTSASNVEYEFTPNAGVCATQYTMYITVTEPEYPGFPDLALCTGTTAPPLPTISPNGILGTWSPATIDNTLSATYQFTPDPGECAISQTMNVTVNEYTLLAIDAIVTNYFEENQIITILATDPGNYLYQLDYGPPQESNVFQDVSSGVHVIKVIDANGCSNPLTRDVLVINYPKFFTPNGDGYNSTWNIFGLSEQLNAKIFIFDRYGKLIKQISPAGEGWDGTYNGQPLPSDDYWFSVDYEENGASENFKAHFSLKR